MSQTVILRPTWQGTVNNIQYGTTHCANWDSAWEQVCEEVCDDGSYFGVGPQGGYGQWGEKSFILSDPALRGAISNVTVLARCKGAASYNCYGRTLVYVGGATYYGNLVYLNADSSFHDLTASYDLNPSTGLAWTWNDIRALEAGSRLGCTNIVGTLCSWVYGIVTFRPAARACSQIIGLPW